MSDWGDEATTATETSTSTALLDGGGSGKVNCGDTVTIFENLSLAPVCKTVTVSNRCTNTSRVYLDDLVRSLGPGNSRSFDITLFQGDEVTVKCGAGPETGCCAYTLDACGGSGLPPVDDDVMPEEEGSDTGSY